MSFLICDRLHGQPGNDTLTGGAGADQFRFDALTDGIDTVTDFTWQENDEIFLNRILDNDFVVGFLPSSQFRIGSGAADSSDRVIYNSSNGNLFIDPDGIGGVAQVQIANLDSGLALIARDFQVF